VKHNFLNLDINKPFPISQGVLKSLSSLAVTWCLV